jgi:hypothetical protein
MPKVKIVIEVFLGSFKTIVIWLLVVRKNVKRTLKDREDPWIITMKVLLLHKLNLLTSHIKFNQLL